MRIWVMLLLSAASLAGYQANASEFSQREKVKTGILPSGGFYSIYEVQCQDQSPASVASVDRGRRWCVTYSEELTCFSRAEEAAAIACGNDSLAMTENFPALAE